MLVTEGEGDVDMLGEIIRAHTGATLEELGIVPHVMGRPEEEGQSAHPGAARGAVALPELLFPGLRQRGHRRPSSAVCGHLKGDLGRGLAL